MPRRLTRLCATVACLGAGAAIAACSASSNPEPQGTTTAALHTAAPSTPKPDKGRPPPEPLDEEVLELISFVSPTGNVSCMLDAEWARCDIIDRDWQPPPRPADCEFDYGQGLQLAPGEPAEFVCAGDTTFGADEVLPYGESVTAGPLRCESAESGITCRDEESGHGFTISRQAYQLF